MAPVRPAPRLGQLLAGGIRYADCLLISRRCRRIDPANESATARVNLPHGPTEQKQFVECFAALRRLLLEMEHSVHHIQCCVRRKSKGLQYFLDRQALSRSCVRGVADSCCEAWTTFRSGEAARHAKSVLHPLVQGSKQVRRHALERSVVPRTSAPYRERLPRLHLALPGFVVIDGEPGYGSRPIATAES
jgi:hypothetical protein